MKISRNKIIVVILVLSFLIFVGNLFKVFETNEFNGNLEQYNRDISVSNEDDTLVFLIKTTDLEEVNRASAFLFVDILTYDVYSSLKQYKNFKYRFFKHVDSVGYMIRGRIDELEIGHQIHSDCPNFMKIKRYIYDSCSYGWVMNGNKAMMYLKNNLHDFDSLTGGEYLEEGTPDIISILIGMGSNCCFMRNSKQLSFLYSLNELSKDEEFRRIWPEYGDGKHIKAIIDLCFKNE